VKSSQLIERLAGVETELDLIVGQLSDSKRLGLAKALNSAKKKVEAVKLIVNEAATMDKQGDLKL